MFTYDPNALSQAIKNEFKLSEHKRLAKQGRSQLELILEYGFESYLTNKIDKTENWDTYKNFFFAAIYDARNIFPDIQEDKELSSQDIDKYVTAYIGKLKDVIEEYIKDQEIRPGKQL